MANSDVLVRFGADVGPLKKGAKDASTSIGGLRNGLKSASKSLKIFAVATTAVKAASTAMGVAMVKSGMAATVEMERLASVAGMTVDEFSRASLAVRAAGVDQEKFADILKDTNDKIGDFLQNGGGPMADFFENIGPKVGVTAEQFKKLNSKDALQLYVSGLEKANLNQQEMTFYMEAIASDATELLPLMRNNGAEMEKYAAKVDSLGLALSDIDAEKVKEAGIAMDQGKQAATAFTQQLAVQFAPVLTGITDLLSEQAGGHGLIQKAAEKSFKFAIKGAGMVGDAIRGIHVIIKGLELGFWGFSVVVNRVMQAIPESVDWVVNSAKASINALTDAMNKLPGIDIEPMKMAASEATQYMTGVTDSALEHMNKVSEEMNALLAKPMPSDSLDAFVAAAQEASEKSAEAAVKVKRENAGLAVNEYEDATDQAGALSKALNGIAESSWKTRFSIVKKGFGALSGLMSVENRKLFNIGKVAAISQASMDGISAAISSFKEGAKLGGPIVGAAYAAASVAATGIQIANLAATSYGSSSSSGGSTSAAISSATTAETASTEASNASNVSISLQGDTFSKSAFTSVVDQINEEIANGAQISGISIV